MVRGESAVALPLPAPLPLAREPLLVDRQRAGSWWAHLRDLTRRCTILIEDQTELALTAQRHGQIAGGSARGAEERRAAEGKRLAHHRRGQAALLSARATQ